MVLLQKYTKIFRINFEDIIYQGDQQKEKEIKVNEAI